MHQKAGVYLFFFSFFGGGGSKLFFGGGCQYCRESRMGAYHGRCVFRWQRVFSVSFFDFLEEDG